MTPSPQLRDDVDLGCWIIPCTVIVFLLWELLGLPGS